ncbi:MAG TPA: PAS domain S-box protein, partial [Candidatus Binatia bacterium]
MKSGVDPTFDAILDVLPVLVWQSGTDKLCTYFNKRWLEFTGRSLEQELGNGWTESVHSEDLPRVLEIYGSAFDRREAFLIEYRLRHHSGEYRRVLDEAAPQFTSDGTFLGYIGGCTDIHQYRLAQQALIDSEGRQTHALQFSNAVMTSMGEGLYTLNNQGLVSYINPAAERILGWSSTELIGRKMHDIIHYRYPDGRPFPASECAGLQVLVSGSIVSNAEDVFIRKDGTFLPVVYSSAPIAKTEITGLVVVFRDMTAQKEAEEALRRSREELRNLANRLQAAREEERTEVARNIHDEL